MHSIGVVMGRTLIHLAAASCCLVASPTVPSAAAIVVSNLTAPPPESATVETAGWTKSGATVQHGRRVVPAGSTPQWTARAKRD